MSKRRWALKYLPLPLFCGYAYYVLSDRFEAHNVRRKEIIKERQESALYKKELDENLKFLENLKKQPLPKDGEGGEQ
jgi:hypothetical protein